MYRKFLVTRTETVTVEARSVSEAEFIGTQALDYFGPDTQDTEVEELEED